MKPVRTGRDRLQLSHNTTLFATKDVPIDRKGMAQVQSLLALEKDVHRLQKHGFFGNNETGVEKIVLTPDFHAGPGIPVGSVVATKGLIYPTMIGGDIGCAMRLIGTDVHIDEFRKLDQRFDIRLRHGFFEGGRNLPMTPEERESILRHGLEHFPARNDGLWTWMQRLNDPKFHHHRGSWNTKNAEIPTILQDFVKGSGNDARDGQTGSIGGGNHFVEFGYTDKIFDRHTAFSWGLKSGYITLLIHTGSVGIGTTIGALGVERAGLIWPNALKKPPHGFLPLPLVGQHQKIGHWFLSLMGMAANFSVYNRMACAAIACKALQDALNRPINIQPIIDVPHNLIFEENNNIVHRKGASPAEIDLPVLLPGSMGSPSYILRGCGAPDALQSAPHGAGRGQARGAARRRCSNDLDGIRLVTRIDLDRARSDIALELKKKLLEESPLAYKSIDAVLDTTVSSGMAGLVSKLTPLLTIKG